MVVPVLWTRQELVGGGGAFRIMDWKSVVDGFGVEHCLESFALDAPLLTIAEEQDAALFGEYQVVGYVVGWAIGVESSSSVVESEGMISGWEVDSRLRLTYSWTCL